MIRLRDVWARGVLKGVSLTIGQGITAIVGKNGSGKTTLLRVIAGLLKPERGEVVAPKKIGASWQNPYYSFYKSTVLEEAILATGDKNRALRLLSRYGLSEVMHRSPFTLSAGQARLLSIILATSWKPDVLLIDEPTSGLGFREKMLLARLLSGLDIPVILASHDLDFILEVANYMVVLDGGRIIHQAPVPEGFYTAELYELGFPKPLAVSIGERLGVVIRSVKPCWLNQEN